MKVIVKINGKEEFETSDLTELENLTDRLDREGADYDIQFEKK